MMLAAEYPFLEVLGSMAVFFLWVMWFWLLIVVLADVFTRRDLSGLAKVCWTVATLLLPLVGVVVYMLVHGGDIAQRRIARAEESQRRSGGTVMRTTSANDPATEIANAKELLDRGAITDSEFVQMKRRALA